MIINWLIIIIDVIIRLQQEVFIFEILIDFRFEPNKLAN
jgi:hypothetical protein